MGLFDKVFGEKPKYQAIMNDEYWQTLTAYRPTFTSWQGAIYESELVRAAIDAKARHISKLSVDFIGSARLGLKSKLKHAPNEWQTWSQFLYRTATILECTNTCFIVPVFDYKGEQTGIYPVLPQKCEIVGYNNQPFLRYTFKNNQRAAVELEKCGILNKFQYSDDFFGETNRALRPTMDLVCVQNQGIGEAVKNSNTFRFMGKLTNFTKPDDLAKERNRFNRTMLESEGGVLLFPSTWAEIKQIESKPYTVDADQMALIRQNVYNYFGVNEKILQNAANGDELDAFFNGAIEPFSIQLSDVLTKMMFTLLERSNGNECLVTANRLQYMPISQKLAMVNLLDRGIITINEMRQVLNYEPIENGDQAVIRGEYYSADDKLNPPTEESEEESNAN